MPSQGPLFYSHAVELGYSTLRLTADQPLAGHRVWDALCSVAHLQSRPELRSFPHCGIWTWPGRLRCFVYGRPANPHPKRLTRPYIQRFRIARRIRRLQSQTCLLLYPDCFSISNCRKCDGHCIPSAWAAEPHRRKRNSPAVEPDH